MKKALFFVLAAALPCLVQSATYGEEVSLEDKNVIRENIIKQINVEPEIVTSIAARRVFSCKFYKVMLSMPDGMSMYFLWAKNEDGKLVTIEDFSTNMQVPILSSLIRKEFRIKNEEDAEVFMEAILTIKSLDSFGSFDRKRPETIKLADEWIFALDKFFEKRSGFIVKTTEDGTITAIRYSLDIPAKE